jgi:hypothetical protein
MIVTPAQSERQETGVWIPDEVYPVIDAGQE